MLCMATSRCVVPRTGYLLVVFASMCVHAGAKKAKWNPSGAFARSQLQYDAIMAFNQSRASNNNSKFLFRQMEKPSATPSLTEEKSETNADDLFDDSNILQGPGKAFKTLNAQLQTIQSQLNAMQSEDASSIAKQREEYEHQLEAQRAEIAAAVAKNARLANVTEDVRKNNKVLRKKASALAVATHKVRVGVNQLQNNVTIAMEFMQTMMNTSETLLNASELQVMRELDLQDMQMQKKMVREKSLNSIGMLQLSSVRKPATKKRNSVKQELGPASLVEGMFAALGEYTEEKGVHEDELKSMFQNRLQAGSDQLQVLHDEYGQMKTTYQAEKERQARLIIAVQHLEKTYKQLVRQRETLLNFLKNLGDRK